jgi:ubiquinone/menaquinone biosynthesis C-methylase UbiE
MTELEAEEYDRWYRTPGGRWIGRMEYDLARGLLQPCPDESLLDVGCGTGYFTRCFARDQAAAVVGVDPDSAVIEYARLHAAGRETYIEAPGEALPFPSRSFDLSLSITALCFVRDQVTFLREMARVTKRALAVGLLRRRSLLWRREGRRGGQRGWLRMCCRFGGPEEDFSW